MAEEEEEEGEVEGEVEGEEEGDREVVSGAKGEWLEPVAAPQHL